jgi:hypothetical protein
MGEEKDTKAAAAPAKAPRKEHGFRVSAFGDQCQSMRSSAAHYSISRTGRHHREKMFITEKHIKTQRLGRESGENTTEVRSTLGGPSMSFPKAAAHDLLNVKEESGVTSNDILKVLVNKQSDHAKWPRPATILIGTDPRGRLKDAELLKTHGAAFYGRCSPGPAGVGGDYGPSDKITRKVIGQAGKFGEKLPSNNWLKINDVPDKVCPNTYARKDDSVGKQYLTHRANQPVHLFGKAPKFEKTRSADTVGNLDVATSTFGSQKLSKNRSEPSVGFGRGTRDGRSRTQMCITKADMGPKLSLPKPVIRQPSLPSDSMVMRSGCG